MISRLNLGCGQRPREGWINLDLVPGAGVDVVADLDRCKTQPLPFPPERFDEFWGSHVLEHLRDPVPFMQELYRVAKPDATATFLLPYGSSDDAFEDPTHVRPWFISSFAVFGQVGPKAPPPNYEADWVTDEIVLDVAADWAHGKTNQILLDEVDRFRNVVKQMRVHFRAQKPARATSLTQVPISINFNFPATE
jgi:predicted SAM-dependent methyltransferase